MGDTGHHEIKQGPVLTSSVAAVKAALDAKNAAQKADLIFQSPEATRKMTKVLEDVQTQLKGILHRLEALEEQAGMDSIVFGTDPGHMPKR